MLQLRAFISVHAWVVWALSAALFFVSFLHPWLWWCVVLALALMLHALVHAVSVRQAFLGSLAAGTAKAAGGTFWIWSAFPLVWLHIESSALQLFLIALDWLLVSIAIGFGTVICVFIYILVRRGTWFVVLFPFLFVLSEVAGSYLFSIAAAGPGSSVNSYFSFGYAGVSLGHVPPLVPLAQFGGIYALSFFAALLGLGTYCVCKSEQRTRRVGFAALCVSVAISVYAYETMEKVTTVEADVIAIETQFPSSMFLDPSGYEVMHAEVREAVGASLTHEADVIILPEDSRFTTSFSSVEDAYAFVDAAADARDVTIIDSARVMDAEGRVWLRAFLHDTGHGGTYAVDKQYLVPHGEYVPYAVTALASLVGMRDALSRTEANQNYQPGPLASQGHVPAGLPRVLFCFESASPLGVRELRDADIPFIAHVVSHAWFHDAVQLERQLESMLRIQAVWNATTIVQAGNMAAARMYLPDGSVRGGERIDAGAKWTLVQF